MNAAAEALVRCFYDEVWKRADEAVAHAILREDFRFRASLSRAARPRRLHRLPERDLPGALGGYTCMVDDLVVTENRAAARMACRGIHHAPLFGVEATGREIGWSQRRVPSPLTVTRSSSSGSSATSTT